LALLNERFRSPLAPLKKGGTGILKVPLLKGDLGGSSAVGAGSPIAVAVQ